MGIVGSAVTPACASNRLRIGWYIGSCALKAGINAIRIILARRN